MRLVLFLASSLFLLSCSAIATGTAIVSAATSKPGVAANVQAGKTNSQTIGTSETVEQKAEASEVHSLEQSVGDTGVRAESVQSVTVENHGAPWALVYVLGILCLLFLEVPRPSQIWRAYFGPLGRPDPL